MSNSWGGGSPSETITLEIQNAVTDGRNGKGCIVVFSTGNNGSGTVTYPASLATVIAVGAMSQCGERKSNNSCDDEKSWSSNYGMALDIVAPGVKIYTTTLNEDYISDFSGTSAACPFVSGVAALVLSVDPSLTGQQARNIIESTAQKVRTDLYNYSTTEGHPNGTWKDEMGYGLVDAYAAVRSVCPKVVYFTDKTVTANTTVVSCGDINVRNVTVTNKARLTLKAAGEVNIISGFEVQLGAELEIIKIQ